MSGITEATLTRPNLPPLERVSGDAYSNRLKKWESGCPTRAEHAKGIMDQGGRSATTLQFTDLTGNPPPLPYHLEGIELSFHSRNTARIHDTVSQLLNSIVTLLKNPGAGDRLIILKFDFNGYQSSNQVDNLFENVFGQIPSQYRDNLLFQTGSFEQNELSTWQPAGSPSPAPREETAAPASDPTRRIILGQEKPPAHERNMVNTYLSTFLETTYERNGLKDRVKFGDNTFSLDENGADIFSGQRFVENSDTEWCLLRAGNHYKLITEETAQHLTRAGNVHPTTRLPFESGDIVRGRAILDLMDKDRLVDEPAVTLPARQTARAMFGSQTFSSPAHSFIQIGTLSNHGPIHYPDHQAPASWQYAPQQVANGMPAPHAANIFQPQVDYVPQINPSQQFQNNLAEQRAIADLDAARAAYADAISDASHRQFTAHTEALIENTARQGVAAYNAAGGVVEQFNQHKTSDDQAKAINDKIQANLEQLKAGLKIGENTFSLDEDGADFISGVEFDRADGNTKWCLLRTNKSFQFITEETASQLIQNGNKHPALNTLLKPDDIVKGQAVLDLMNDNAATAESAPNATV